MEKKLPFEIEDLDPEITANISRDFSDGLPTLVRAGPGKMVILGSFRDLASQYYNFELKKDDVIICGFPRSGTTLTQETVWLLLNNLDFETAKNVHYSIRVPLFEGKSYISEKTKERSELFNTVKNKAFYSAVELLQDVKEGPRVFKTHLHFQLLPPNLFKTDCKIIYIARHPKDVIVSFYHLLKTVSGREFNKDFKTFYDYFKNDLLLATPYWAHIKQGWEKRNEKNLKFLFYEDFTKDLRKGVEDLSNFLGKDYSSKQLDKLAENLQIDNFKRYINVMDTNFEMPKSDFVRKGKIGGWRKFFDEEMNSDADKWISENAQKIGITYPLNNYYYY